MKTKLMQLSQISGRIISSNWISHYRMDGIIGMQNQRLLLSDKASLVMTHALRASHDAILVGIKTVLADNPSLNVRFVSRGPNQNVALRDPIVVVVDARLETPITAKFLSRKPIILYNYSSELAAPLQAAGAILVHAPVDLRGRIDLRASMEILLNKHGIKSIMVEGGARIIQSFYNLLMPMWVVVTLSPQVIGSGIRAVDSPISLRLDGVEYTQFGTDMVVSGRANFV